MISKIKTLHSFAFFLLALLAAGLNIYIVKTFDIFGSPLLFAGSLVVEFIFVVVAIYCLTHALVGPGRLLESVLSSGARGIMSDPNVIKLLNTKSPTLLWIGRRLKISSPVGLGLTITLGLVAFLFYQFSGVLIAIIGQSKITDIDTRIANVMPSVRTASQTAFFGFITFLANIEPVILLLLLSFGLLWRKKQRLLAGVFVIVAVSEETSTYILKHLVHRMRPDRALSLITEDSSSFPSGHTMRATVLFGLVAYILYKSCNSFVARGAVIIGFILAVFLVGLSRIYLGAHYPSDVLASVLFGGGLLTLVIGALEIGTRFGVPKFKTITLVNREFWIIPIAVVIFSAVLSPVFIRLQPTIATLAQISIPAINDRTLKQLPLYSETLTGSRMEPVGFIYAGYEDQIVSIFSDHGWYKSDPSTVGNTLRAVAVGFQGGQYLNAPVTPSYLDAKPQTLAFEQPTENNSLRQRHHTRIWRTNFVLPDGTPVWVGTASLDEGVEFAGPAKLPTHRINPNIDAERDYIVKSLGLKPSLIQAVQAQLGKNASGDAFFTDGRAAYISL